MDDRQGTSKMTYITLAAQLVGFFTVIWSPFLIVLYIPVVLLPYVKPIQPHHWLRVTSFSSTTLIFGLINGWTLLQLLAYFSSSEAAVPTLSIYLSLTTLYHYFEFQLVNNFHYPTLSWHSFLIYHSKHYTIANVFMFAQHIVTRYLFAFEYKMYHPLMWIGLAGALAGEGLRIAAFFTCKSNFTHLVSFNKKQKHTLVTNGVYSIFRHPAYTGFFYYSVFSQLFLGNFITMLGFILALIHFFTKRIKFQEEALLHFFQDYPDYKARTGIYIPFVKDPQFNHYQKASAQYSD